MNLPASGGMSSHFPAPPFTWIVICGMMSGLLRVIVLLMASLSSLSGAPRLDVALSPGFTVEDALRASFGETPRTVVLHGVNGAEAPHAVVQACRNEEGLFFVFHCSDRNVVSPGREDGLDHFRLGDTVEVFLGRRGEPGYVEIHATPAGKKSLYFFDGYRSRIAAPPEAGLVRVDSVMTQGGWRAVMSVPWSVLGAREAGEEWEIFLGRYDYDAEGATPVLSSFPAQRGAKPDFHRRADYAALRFLP